ncbi:MAG: class I SAM-dependent RNA methyltransferase, partial [Paracoccaceae bacterium]
VPGGVLAAGGLAEAARANLRLRCAVRVLARVAEFRAMHLAQLDKRARKVDWAAWLSPHVPLRVEAVCHRSRIYHHKAAAGRVARAIAEGLGATVSDDAALVVKIRIDDDLCTISLDTTGEPLHRRGHKQFVAKAPLRETMAAGFLRQMGFTAAAPVSVVDPMCGSGTIPIEAAEIALGLWPGRSRGFALEALAGGAEALEIARAAMPAAPKGGISAPWRFLGHDRDQGAVRGAAENAARAGVADWCRFTCQPISALERPDGPAGLVLVNPPYGARIGERKLLYGLYGSLGAVLKDRFRGWRVGIVTSDPGLAKATGLSIQAGAPVAHGSLKVQLWQASL